MAVQVQADDRVHAQSGEHGPRHDAADVHSAGEHSSARGSRVRTHTLAFPCARIPTPSPSFWLPAPPWWTIAVQSRRARVELRSLQEDAWEEEVLA